MSKYGIFTRYGFRSAQYPKEYPSFEKAHESIGAGISCEDTRPLYQIKKLTITYRLLDFLNACVGRLYRYE